MSYQPLADHSGTAQSCDWEEAQPYCNFVLFKPQDAFLEKFKVIETSLRFESSIDFISHRCILQLSTSTLSIKQFLYDWAPPAYDHPSLWRNSAISPQELTSLPKPLVIGHNIAWTGLNFRRQQAATLNVLRTMVEITVIEGTVKNEDFLEICKALRPVDSEITKRISQTPLAMLTYMWRHKRNASPVPLSYWNYKRSDKRIYTAHIPKDITHTEMSNKIFNQYHLDSIFLIGEVSNPAEIEYYYEHIQYPGAYIRLLTTPKHQKDFFFPPKLGDQTCSVEQLVIEGHNIHYAFLTEEFGPYEAIWMKERKYLALVKPMLWTTKSWFLENIKSLIKDSH